MKHDEKSEQLARRRERQATPDCDQCELIGATNCCQASGGRLQLASCATGNADNLVESSELSLGRCKQNGGTIEWRCCPQTVSNRRRESHLKSTAMTIDNLFNGAVKRCDRPLGLALAGSALLLLAAMAAPALALHLSPLEGKFLDTSCNSLAEVSQTSNAYQLLLTLRCDILPLYELYVATYHNGNYDTEMGKHPMDEFAKFRKRIRQFSSVAEEVWRLREFCSWNTFDKLSSVKDIVKDSKLLTLAYDLVAIELHTSCIEQTITKLPSVPNLVKDVAKIYIGGLDKPMFDLNSPGTGEMDDDAPFDVDAAVQKNGPLEETVGLSLTVGLGLDNNPTVQEFRSTCKNFVITIEKCWETMEMMNRFVATDGNAIKQMNNYTLRKLAPTKLADICSKISERA